VTDVFNTQEYGFILQIITFRLAGVWVRYTSYYITSAV
jgi:hypothetical protein